jgi:hypothetical protein
VGVLQAIDEFVGGVTAGHVSSLSVEGAKTAPADPPRECIEGSEGHVEAKNGVEEGSNEHEREPSDRDGVDQG